MGMYDDLRRWKHSRYSECKLGTFCEQITNDAKSKMIAASERSGVTELEIGMPIQANFSLGEQVTGGEQHVEILRDDDTIGTFHTHHHGFCKPSAYDLMDALTHGDVVTCVGASGMIGTKVACFTPKQPEWDDLRAKLDWLQTRIDLFNAIMRKKYRETKTNPEGKVYTVALRGRKLREAMTNDEGLWELRIEQHARHLTKEIGDVFPVERCIVIWETLKGIREDELPEWTERMKAFYEEKKL